jgi:hypothetical protein
MTPKEYNEIEPLFQVYESHIGHGLRTGIEFYEIGSRVVPQ